MRRRFVVLGLGGFALAALGGYAALGRRGVDSDFAALGRNIDDVNLINHDGEAVRWGRLAGRPRAVFFGFTHCPVICPVTIYELTAALDRLGASAADIAIEFVTIDPERDTPERLKAYFSGFGPRVTGFSGETGAVARVAAAFEVVARRSPLADGGYTMDHTASVFLLNRRGRVEDVIAYGTPQDIIDERLGALSSRPARP